MRGVTSPVHTWHSLVSRLPQTPMLVFLLVSLPLTAVSVYVLPYFEFAVPKFVWMVVLVLAVVLFQIRASMEHAQDRYLNALTSYPINFVSLPTLYAGFVAFSSTTPVTQSFSATFLGLATLLYVVYALVRNRMESALYKLLIRKGSTLVQFLVVFALGMMAVWALPSPARAQLDEAMRGPAASWQEQLSAAQAKVAERDTNAVLSRVTASAPYPLWRGYLTVNFYFVTDKPVLYLVRLQDWNPAATASIEEYTADNRTPAPEAQTADLSTFRRFLPYIKLSPRDVLQLTAPDAENDGITWSIDLTLNPRSASLIPLWEVTHTTNSINSINSEGIVQTYSILADTGTILGSSPPK